jgi:ketosteroid isomerase-like protein
VPSVSNPFGSLKQLVPDLYYGLASRSNKGIWNGPKGPTPPDVTGKYVVVWEKVEGDWKLAADIWNDGK